MQRLINLGSVKPCENDSVGEPELIGVTHLSSPPYCFLWQAGLGSDLLIFILKRAANRVCIKCHHLHLRGCSFPWDLAGPESHSPTTSLCFSPARRKLMTYRCISWCEGRGAECGKGLRTKWVWGRMGNKAAVGIVAFSGVFASSVVCADTIFSSICFPFWPFMNFQGMIWKLFWDTLEICLPVPGNPLWWMLCAL